MNVNGALDFLESKLNVTTPDLRALSEAVGRVQQRWPVEMKVAGETVRDERAEKLSMLVRKGGCRETHLAVVADGAAAVFDPTRTGEEAFSDIRQFIYEEIEFSSSSSFLSAMLNVYLDCYEPHSDHTVLLASKLGQKTPHMSTRRRRLLDQIPELLDPSLGPQKLAERMAVMGDPYKELGRLGIRRPINRGFMRYAHNAFTALVEPRLTDIEYVKWFFHWLECSGFEKDDATSASVAIKALLEPWQKQIPCEELSMYLVDSLLEFFGPPILTPGSAWTSVDQKYIKTFNKLNSREVIHCFSEVIDATRKYETWPPRRHFWMQLYDEGRISAAWVAFSKDAYQYAAVNLRRKARSNNQIRFARQLDRPNKNVSLLIMQIDDKIIVDGCHNYRTHVFDCSDPMAPTLFEKLYDCREIMKSSQVSRPHGYGQHGVSQWEKWVRDIISVNVPR